MDDYEYDAFDPDNGDDAETYERNCLAAELADEFDLPEDAGLEAAFYPEFDLDF